MLYAEDAGIVSTSADGIAKMMAVVVTVFEAEGRTISEKKAETILLRTPSQTTLAPPLVIEAAGLRYKQAAQFLYLGGNIHGNDYFSLKIDRRIRLMQACPNRFGPELYELGWPRAAFIFVLRFRNHLEVSYASKFGNSVTGPAAHLSTLIFF